MVNHPTDQRFLKSDVVSSLFRLKPLVSQDFVPFRIELSIER